MTVFQGARRAGGGPERRAEDLSTLTTAQLRALCAERGIQAPAKATKTRLLRLLQG